MKRQAHIKKALADAAPDQNNWKYSLRDSDELVAAVISYYKKRYGVDLTADEIQSCNGTQDGMGHIGLVLCNEGDTVLLPTPLLSGVHYGGHHVRGKGRVLSYGEGKRFPSARCRHSG